jgi:hypothetical protein
MLLIYFKKTRPRGLVDHAFYGCGLFSAGDHQQESHQQKVDKTQAEKDRRSEESSASCAGNQKNPPCKLFSPTICSGEIPPREPDPKKDVDQVHQNYKWCPKAQKIHFRLSPVVFSTSQILAEKHD